MRSSPRLVACLLFCSGLCALVYQTAWQRGLRLVFGASTAASAAVLAVFLGGLGAGGVVLGRRAERSAKPLELYGNLELGVALTAAVSPLLMDLLGRLYLLSGGSQTLGPVVATILRLVITMVAIGPSVVLMGGTLPAAARAVEGEHDRARSKLALLYGVNTLGAVGGALLGTFVLFEVFGIRMALWITAGLNLVVAIVARAVGRDSDEVPRDSPAPDISASDRRPSILACGVAGGVGFAFLLLEIVWYRLLAPILGGSTYTFGLILAVALAGIGLGGYAYSRRPQDRPATLSELATITALEGVFVALPIALGDHLAIYAALTRPMSNLGFSALVASWASVTVVVVFPAALASGYQFPLLFALLGSGRAGVARHVGTLYAFNTGGSIVGSLLGGFYLIPRLGAVGCFRLVGGLLAALALVTVAVGVRRDRRRLVPALLFVALCLVFTTRSGPSAVWRHQPIGAGRVRVPSESRNALRAWMMEENQRVMWQADGIETTVAVTRADQLSFVVDGKTDGSVVFDCATQAGSSLVVAAMHPAPKRALVIGLGTGMTAGWMAAISGVEHVDVVEFEPSVVEVARAMSAANQNVLSRPNVALHFGDGREFTLTSRKSDYDLIVSEPSNPYRAGISALYTREMYQAVARRLREHGIFGQWVQGYEIDAETLRSAVRTLRSVFRHVEAWQTEFGDLLFLAAQEPLVVDVDRLRQRITEEPYRTGLPRTLLIGDAEGLLGRFLANEAVLADISELPGVAINTDDLNTLDYAFARAVGTTNQELPLELLKAAIGRHGDRPATRGEVDWERVEELRPRASMVSASDVPQLAMPSADARHRSEAMDLGCRGFVQQALQRWEAQRGEPRDLIERYIVGMGLADRGDERSTALADRLSADGFTAEAGLLRARKALHDKNTRAAADATVRAIDGLRNEPLPLCSTSQQVLAIVQSLIRLEPGLGHRLLGELSAQPFAAYLSDDTRVRLMEKIATETADVSLCVRAFGRHVEEPMWERAHLEARLACLTAVHHPAAAKARDDLVEFLRNTQGTVATNGH